MQRLGDRVVDEAALGSAQSAMNAGEPTEQFCAGARRALAAEIECSHIIAFDEWKRSARQIDRAAMQQLSQCAKFLGNADPFTPEHAGFFSIPQNSASSSN